MYVKYMCNEKPTCMNPLAEPQAASRAMTLTLGDGGKKSFSTFYNGEWFHVCLCVNVIHV